MELEDYHKEQLKPIIGFMDTYESFLNGEPQIIGDLVKEGRNGLAILYTTYQATAFGIASITIAIGLEAILR